MNIVTESSNLDENLVKSIYASSNKQISPYHSERCDSRQEEFFQKYKNKNLTE